MAALYDHTAEPEVIEAAGMEGPCLVPGIEPAMVEQGVACLLTWHPKEMCFQVLCLEAGAMRYWRRTTGSPNVARMWWESVLSLPLSDWGVRRIEELTEGMVP
ncbi:hypothetical protein [Rubrobacter calidifluminis]|uniref:hypothetical protein n=1 Tax=Rubrobacter calidifluminis TaxID=1392640 RepID=UPI002362579A|nr:hypothetical protein [Rubrobacter calidifluminis]